jgi:hypothetical protein
LIELVVTAVTLVAQIVTMSGPSGYTPFTVVGAVREVPPPRMLLPKSRTIDKSCVVTEPLDDTKKLKIVSPPVTVVPPV